MDISNFQCFQVNQSPAGEVVQGVTTITLDDLPPGEVVIQVEWSSLNYKDALAAGAHPGVAGPLPHVPGIDAAGKIVQSSDDALPVGLSVLVTGYELGAPAWGGWSQYIRVPAAWVVPLPQGISAREAMLLGTAGFTAAQCVRELETHGVRPDSGPLLVTGATGGVGVYAVRLLSQLGYEVHAVTGKQDRHADLKALGAAEVHGRDVLQDNPKRPLLSATWAGGVDTVGGDLLVSFLKSTQVNGCVSACGLVAGHKLSLTVYPFILRGVCLAGVTSALCPRPEREDIWQRLAGPWRMELPATWVREITLPQLPTALPQILAGDMSGRTVIKLSSS